MQIITETELRNNYRQEPFKTFLLPTGCRLTPAASQFLSERRIEIVSAKSTSSTNTQRVQPSGGLKPEHMTHLRGTQLICKNQPIIKFRGKLDSLQAILLSTILEVEGVGYHELVRELRELLDFCRQVMKAEVKEEPLQPVSFNQWSPQEIRERSHYPNKYYETSHFIPQPEHGRVMAQLNYIRTQCRELELTAIEAFFVEDNLVREDIITALNRFSSFVYILMIQNYVGHYKVGVKK